MKEKILDGWIREGEYGENCDALMIANIPVAKWFDDEELFEQPVTVSYYISDEPKSREKAQTDFINKMLGNAEGQYTDVYSEITGYLWTDEELKIGGHDLLSELRSYLGKYAILVVQVGTP